VGTIEDRPGPFAAVVEEVLRDLGAGVGDVTDAERLVVIGPVAREGVVSTEEEAV